MAENSNIEWTKNTWNPWRGCNHVSPGCFYCYADRLIAGRRKQDFKHLTRASRATFNVPNKWNKEVGPDAPLMERLVFTCSLSDFFHKAADEWRDEAWAIIRNTPNLIYQILTKRPERVLQCLPSDWGSGYPNVWLGTSVENQETANKRLPIMWDWHAKMDNIFFVSFEPLLEAIDLTQVPGMTSKSVDSDGLKDWWFEFPFHWAIIGGESGNDVGKYLYRPCDTNWIKSLAFQLQCDDEMAVFVKQLGTHLYKELNLSDRKGGAIEEWPITLDAIKVRQFPLF